MKTSNFLWQFSGSLQELANQLEIAKSNNNWQTVAIISQILVKKANECEKLGEKFYDLQD